MAETDSRDNICSQIDCQNKHRGEWKGKLEDNEGQEGPDLRDVRC
jgi:hypothetical protein